VRARARAAELEAAIAASLADAEADSARPGGPPPAAKFAVRALRTEALTAERLDALGGAGVECCVCRCAGQAAARLDCVPSVESQVAVRHVSDGAWGALSAVALPVCGLVSVC
jgi:hypothetical protein